MNGGLIIVKHLPERAGSFIHRRWRGIVRWMRRHEPIWWGGVIVAAVLASYLNGPWVPVGKKALEEAQAEAIAVVLGVTGLFISRQVHFWNQRKSTIEVASRWNDGELSKARSKVIKFFPPPWNPDKPLTIDELATEFRQHPDLRRNLVAVLNHLDMVAMGADQGIYSPRPIHHLYGYVLTEWYRHFGKFVEGELARSPARQEPSVTPLWYLDFVGRAWTQNLTGWRPTPAIKNTALAQAAPPSGRTGRATTAGTEGDMLDRAGGNNMEHEQVPSKKPSRRRLRQ